MKTAIMKTAIELADAIDNSEETTGFERRCASMLRTLSQENEALKADAERWKTIKPHFYFDNEGGHGFWNCSISSESWTVDGVVPDAAIDAMKGKS